ncbi:glycosyltransferase domain-containing protein [Rhizobium etli 8C-3]|uniref:Glycosyltransferase domain-containing protein n=1 Tax=Rhizobium etli 8C-3 TaxID=538025 RepID=A0A1L5P758_RHIET|nr:glycosyltransferase [Rhizobium etli]APO75975.1 glycosyltransferase domain-containing protein [Rhizobium etli 8C-3]
MKIAFYGSSLVSAYWNGAATYYRGLLRSLAEKGYEITFYEPDVYDRQKYRDMEPPDWCKVVVYEGTIDALKAAARQAAEADIVVKASGVGFQDDLLLEEVLGNASPKALKIFWDVDAPATLAELKADPDHPLRQALFKIDLVLTYGGGDPVVNAYRSVGAAECVPIYNALDPQTHHPVPEDSRFAADLGFLGNRLPDREARVEYFFLDPASRLPGRTFLLGGSGWQDKPMSSNVNYIGHVPTRDHNAFNVTPMAVLNISRASMAENGFSPATRVFEAAGAGACLITDHWEGIELFLKPDEEILVARDGQDVAALIAGLSRQSAARIGARARMRVLADHTYAHRARAVDEIFRARLGARMEAAK